MSVLGLMFVDIFKQSLVDENHDWGHQYIFRFPNNYGASVVRNRGSYGNEQDLWEMALIFFDVRRQLASYIRARFRR